MRCTISWSLLATVYLSGDENGIGGSKFLLESALECPYVYYALPLLRDRLHFVRCRCRFRERVWYSNIDGTGARKFRDPRK